MLGVAPVGRRALHQVLVHAPHGERVAWVLFRVEREYLYVVERGAVPAPEQGETPGNAVRLNGQTLLELERGHLGDAVAASQAKSLMRLLINHSLNGQELATRAMVRDLQRMEGEG